MIATGKCGRFTLLFIVFALSGAALAQTPPVPHAVQQAAHTYITRAALVEELRSAFVLADYPNYAADWRQLDRQSTETATQLRDTIADTVTPCRPAGPSVVTTLTVQAA